MIKELKTYKLFTGLNDEEVGKFVPLASLIRFPADNLVFKEGDPSEGIYLVKSGKVEISKVTPDGWRQPLVLLQPGHFLGEIALLENTNHRTDARTIEASELLLIPKGSFEEMERTEPFIMLKIIKNIAIISGMNIRRMNEKFIKALINY